MITLFRKTISDKHTSFKPYKKLADRCINRSFPLDIQGPKGFYLSFIITEIFRYCKTGFIIVTPTESEAKQLHSDLIKFEPDVLLFPEWHILPYSESEPSLTTAGERASALLKMEQGKNTKMICSLKSVLAPVPSPDFLSVHGMTLSLGDTFYPQSIEEKLSFLGYLKVPKVSIPGEFALRGEVLDVFMPAHNEPVRIVFEFDEIEEIKYFDPIVQSSTEKLSEITLHPLKEVIWTDERVTLLKDRLSTMGMEDAELESIIETLNIHKKIKKEEMLFPLSFGQLWSIFDYGGEQCSIVLVEYERIKNTGEVLAKEYQELFKQQEQGIRLPVTPASGYHPYSIIDSIPGRTIRFPVLSLQGEKEGIILPSEPSRSFFGNINYLKEELKNLSDTGYEIFIFSESENQNTKISFLLKDIPAQIMEAHISAGFALPEMKLIVIQENEIFGRRRHVPTSVKKAKTKAIDTFVELNPGDYVVHINYGIGKFLGIERIEAAGTERDYIKLLYADEESVFIPIEQVNLVQRYIGSEGNVPRLDKLGGKSWEKRKKICAPVS